MINGSFRTILLLGNYIIHYSNLSSFITNEDHTQMRKSYPCLTIPHTILYGSLKIFLTPGHLSINCYLVILLKESNWEIYIYSLGEILNKITENKQQTFNNFFITKNKGNYSRSNEKIIVDTNTTW